MGAKRKQTGIVMPLVVVGLVAILAMSGLALTAGNAFWRHARLQNALDAAALSGAKVVNDGRLPAEAAAAARATFAAVWPTPEGATAVEPVVEFSPTLIPFVPGGTGPYVRVRAGGIPLPVWFVHLVPGVGETMALGSSAVSGPGPVGTDDADEVCDVLPLMICGDPAADTDCSDGACFGYTLDADNPTELVLKSGVDDSQSEWEVGPGNFQVLDFDCSGFDCVRGYLAGEYQGCHEVGEEVTTQPGNGVGPVAQGINTRFGVYQGGMSSADFPPDLITRTSIWNGEYEDLTQNGPYDFPGSGVEHRRIVAAPIGDCTETTEGRGDVPVLGIGCFFLTRPAGHAGQSNYIYAEMIDRCEAGGEIGTQPGPADGSEPYRIILYKDPDSTKS